MVSRPECGVQTTCWLIIGMYNGAALRKCNHPSCSRQHAVLQYRCIPGKGADGQKIKRVLPYIIDLESSNGTFLNNKKIEPKRYHELREKDVLKFGFSSREYVLLHDQSDHGEDSD